jgi:hypothetical protein
MRSIGDAFSLDLELPAGHADKQLYVLTSAPSLVSGSQRIVLARHPARVDGRRLTVDLPPFHRAGYFDWRVVSISPDQEYLPVPAPPALRRQLLQGRFIVHPPLRSEIMHEGRKLFLVRHPRIDSDLFS